MAVCEMTGPVIIFCGPSGEGQVAGEGKDNKQQGIPGGSLEAMLYGKYDRSEDGMISAFTGGYCSASLGVIVMWLNHRGVCATLCCLGVSWSRAQVIKGMAFIPMGKVPSDTLN